MAILYILYCSLSMHDHSFLYLGLWPFSSLFWLIAVLFFIYVSGPSMTALSILLPINIHILYLCLWLLCALSLADFVECVEFVFFYVSDPLHGTTDITAFPADNNKKSANFNCENPQTTTDERRFR